jgi:hypothetical protein
MVKLDEAVWKIRLCERMGSWPSSWTGREISMSSLARSVRMSGRSGQSKSPVCRLSDECCRRPTGSHAQREDKLRLGGLIKLLPGFCCVAVRYAPL